MSSPPPPVLFSAKVLYEFEASADDECAVQPGEVVEVLEVQGEWWACRVAGSNGARTGILPANYVEKIVVAGAWSSILPVVSFLSRRLLCLCLCVCVCVVYFSKTVLSLHTFIECNVFEYEWNRSNRPSLLLVRSLLTSSLPPSSSSSSHSPLNLSSL